MKTLSATLLAAQKGVGVTGDVYPPIWKIVLSRSGQTTRGYDIERVIEIKEGEEDDSQTAQVILDNSDGALTSLNFEMFQGVIGMGYNTGVSRSAWVANTAYSVADVVIPTTANGYQYRCTVAGTSHGSTEPTWGTALGVTQADNDVTWELDGYTSDEYSNHPPLKVQSQEFLSTMGLMRVHLYLVGVPNQLAQDLATAEYTLTSSDTQTVKTLVSAIAAKTMTGFTDYTAVPATYDSEDAIIDAFKPADYFKLSENESRREKIKELLDYTGCKMRFEADGLHILDPVTTGTTYDYEYRLEVATYHTFFDKNLRHRFVNPNKEIVKSHPDNPTQYNESATSATSYALAPRIHTTKRRLTSSTEASNIAAAIIERYELNSETGSIKVPMNVGQEVWDYIKVTDARQNDTRTGNVQSIERRCRITSKGAVFDMTIHFGKVSTGMLPGFTGSESGGPPNWAQMSATIDYLRDNLKALYDAHNELVAAFNDRDVSETMPKLHVTEQLIIPVVEDV